MYVYLYSYAYIVCVQRVSDREDYIYILVYEHMLQEGPQRLGEYELIFYDKLVNYISASVLVPASRSINKYIYIYA